jgi:hypothetical protein
MSSCLEDGVEAVEEGNAARFGRYHPIHGTSGKC